MNYKILRLIFFYVVFLFQSISLSKEIKCQKEAEAVGISESKKKGNLPDHLLSVANPTEQEGANIVVYIGARANYNYFKMKFNKKCKLIKMVEVEYTN